MTTPQRWQEIDRVFAAVLEREPGDRQVFLVEACGGDEELMKEVESLLAHDSSDSLVSPLPAEEATRLLTKSHALTLENKTIGHYKIARFLGIGGMGAVYLGHDLRLNRPVAIKLLSSYNATEAERLHRFRKEALAASALNHPNILTIYEIGEFEEHNFIVTEFVDGQTLLELIRDGRLSLQLAIDIAIQMASALTAAHSVGIVHRDIKPANVMVRADDLVKVLDFGIAKFTATTENHPPGGSALETLPGSVVGTAAYMSPEQARGLPIDDRTDVWSLGVVLYEMVTGKRPFHGDTPLDVMSAVINNPPKSLTATAQKVPARLQDVVHKALQKDRASRYQTAQELLSDLKDLRKQLESSGEGESGAASDVERADNESGQARTIALTKGGTDHDKARATLKAAELNSPRIISGRNLTVAALVFAVALSVAAFAYWTYNRGSFQAKSIAVLPFKNESGNSELDYLSDGITDSLISSLSQLPQVTVKARNSVFRYKNANADPQQVGSELSVEAILNGRVVQRGDDLTLYLSLVDASNGNQVWGEQYDRKLSDLVLLQRDIARDVSEKLRLKLSGAEERRVTKDYTANSEAYRLYLRGRFHIQKLTPPEVQQGIAHLQKAIELDPSYALAYAGLSEANRSLALGSELPPREYLSRAKVAAQKALQLDEELAEAHTALGVSVFWLERNRTESENEFRRALQLNPNIAETHLFYAHMLSNTGRHNEALAEIKRARELDPLSPFMSALEGQFLLHAGRIDEALAKLNDTFVLAPDFWFPHVFASSAFIEKRMFTEAVAEARRATELSPFQTVSLAFEGYALVKLGRRDEARAILDKLLELSQQRFVPPCHIALLYNALGEREQTLMWLERALEVGDPKLGFLKVEPKWNNLRNDPQFQDLMIRAGFGGV